MIKGSLVALITPMTEQGTVDFRMLDTLVEFHINEGTHGIVAVGTTGESATLTYEEHAEVIRKVVDKVAGRVPVIAGTGANSTHEAIDLTQRAKEAGADACLLVTPYYNKPTQEGLFQHFSKIAKSVDIPQILYNVPGRTACDMTNKTTLRLATIKNIIGIKDATGDLIRAKELIDNAPENFALYTGDDLTSADFMLLGGHGTISVTANVAPAKIAKMACFALEGDVTNTKLVDSSLLALHKNLFLESNPIPVKWACHQLGLCGLDTRLPLTVLSSEFHDAVLESLKEAEVL